MRDRWILFFAFALILTSIVFASVGNDRNSSLGNFNNLVSSSNNIKEYNSLEKIVTIKDNKGIELASIKLLTPLNNKVGLGYQKVAEFEIDGKVSYSDFLKQMYFFDVKNNNQGIKRGFDLKKEIVTQREEPIYSLVDTGVKDINGNTIYQNKQTGTKITNFTNYELLSKNNFDKEKQVISIWVQIDKPEQVEWIPELYGVVVNEWASWTADLNVGLVSYWKLDETTGTTAYDSNTISANNGTNTNSVPINQTGKIGTSYGDFNTTKKITFGTVPATIPKAYNSPLSICAWINPTVTTTGYIASVPAGANKFSWDFAIFGTSVYMEVCKVTVGCADARSNAAISQGVWSFVCGTFSGTNDVNGVKLYVNGVLQNDKDTYSYGSISNADGEFAIGNLKTDAVGFTGKIDEVGIWGKTLSDSDINYMYNNGSGMTIGGSSPSARVDWNVYQAGTSTHLTNVSGDCNVNAMDFSGQNSPVTGAYVDQNTSFSCNFTRTGYDANNSYTGVADSNKTLVIYMTDSTAPTVGATVANGFTIVGSQIWGTGIISATASDTGSDINSTGCAYTDNNGSTWSYGIDYNGTHCYKTGVTISSGTDYNFAFKAYDKANNVGTTTSKASYTADNIPPTIGTITLTGFTTYTTYIKGTGQINATITDAVSGIASCQYSLGTTWIAGDTNATHCYKAGITITNGTVYDFNIRAYDNATNLGTGTKVTRTGDTLPPVTTVTITDYNNSPYKFIHATCADAGSGCKAITFEFDGNGTKFYNTGATFDMNFYGLGSHYFTYYSTDNLDTNETTSVHQDLNMPILLTIKYPKNIATLNQLTEKWTLLAIGGVSLSVTDLNTDYNVYVQPNILTTFTIGDVNGNYTQNTYTRTYYADSNTGYDTLQPYLYAVATSLATTINVRSATTNLPIPNVTIKVYGNLPGLGNTLIGQGTTDDKGQILQLFIAGQAYTLDIYYGGVLIKTYNITATSNTINILLDIGGIVVPPTTQHVFTANWTPSPNLLKAYTGTQAFTQTLNNINSDTISILSMLTQNGVYLDANQTYTGASNKTFTHTINWITINTYPIISKMIVTASDGNVYTFTQTYQVYVSDSNTYGGTYNPLTGLQSGLRHDLSCEWNTPTYYLSPCFPLFFIALIICIGLVIGASMVLGQFSGQSAGLIFLASMILFTYLTWVPVYVTAGLVLIMLAFLANDRGGQ